MKKNYIRFKITIVRRLSFIAFSFLMVSCVSQKFTADTRTGQPVPLDTLNLLSVMIGPVYQPVIPLIDAAAFNGKTNKIAEDIVKAEQERIEAIKDDFVATLRQKLPVVIRTSKDLNSYQIDAYRVEKAVPAEHNNFPLVLFADRDLSFQQYGKMKNIRNEFESNYELRQNIAGFAEKFNLSNVAICYNRLAVISVGPFGSTGALRWETYLFVYDRRGEIVIEAKGFLEPATISGKILDEYTAEINKYKMMHNLLSIPLAKQIMP